MPRRPELSQFGFVGPLFRAQPIFRVLAIETGNNRRCGRTTTETKSGDAPTARGRTCSKEARSLWQIEAEKTSHRARRVSPRSCVWRRSGTSGNLNQGTLGATPRSLTCNDREVATDGRHNVVGDRPLAVQPPTHPAVATASPAPDRREFPCRHLALLGLQLPPRQSSAGRQTAAVALHTFMTPPDVFSARLRERSSHTTRLCLQATPRASVFRFCA